MFLDKIITVLVEVYGPNVYIPAFFRGLSNYAFQGDAIIMA